VDERVVVLPNHLLMNGKQLQRSRHLRRLGHYLPGAV
jgi:hypothetical protein